MISNQNSPPVVSFIIPVYNAEQFISSTLNSVLSQTFNKTEILIVNDGSNDRSQNIIDTYSCKDSRIRVFNQYQSGVAAARNLAIKYATGEYIASIDSDDIWQPNTLKLMLDCFSHSGPEVGLVYAWSAMIDENGRATGKFITSNIRGNVLNSLICSNFIGNASATLIRRHCFDVVGNYSLLLRELNAEGCEDWDFYLRIAEHFRFDRVPKFLVGYRKTTHSMSSNLEQMSRSHAQVMLFSQKRSPHLPSILFKISSSHFCIYLAKLCKQNGNQAKMLYWLNKALKASISSSFIHHQFYILYIKALHGKTSHLVSCQVKQKIANEIQGVINKNTGLPVTFAAPKNLSLLVKTKQLFDTLLHKAISLL